jgi:hypothetical protein
MNAPRPSFEHRGARCVKYRARSGAKGWVTLLDGIERPVIAPTPKLLRRKIDAYLGRKAK